MINDQSIASTKTKHIKLNTKTQNIFCRLSENLHFERRKKFYLLKCIQKSNVILKNWVLVFSFIYLVLVDAMDKSNDTFFSGFPNH